MAARQKTYDDKCRQAGALQDRVDELESAIRELGESGALGRLAEKLNAEEARSTAYQGGLGERDRRIGALERQVEALTAENVRLAFERETALAVVEAKYDPGDCSDGTPEERAHRAEERAASLERRVAELQAANESMDIWRKQVAS
jgi:polyhydroxyalkanoate synthesis regulator phasin